jgi:hypothetical protein
VWPASKIPHTPPPPPFPIQPQRKAGEGQLSSAGLHLFDSYSLQYRMRSQACGRVQVHLDCMTKPGPVYPDKCSVIRIQHTSRKHAETTQPHPTVCLRHAACRNATAAYAYVVVCRATGKVALHGAFSYCNRCMLLLPLLPLLCAG